MTNRVPAEFPADLPCKIAFVGEAPGVPEERKGYPFAGKAGKEFNRMLRIAGIIRHEHLVTNVFDTRLIDNDIESICHKNKKAAEEAVEVDDEWAPWLIQPAERGKYIRREYAVPALERLRGELEKAQPNVIVPLGNTALWAVTGMSGVASMRGSIMKSELVPGAKVIPTFHPALVLRQWRHRFLCIQDFMKIRAECEFPEVKIRTRHVWTEPTLEDLREFKRRYIDTAHPETPLSVDIETLPARRHITCIGFAPDTKHALVVPFVDMRKPDLSYWDTAEEELEAKEFCREILESDQPKLGQNFVYDWQWLFEVAGIRVRNYLHDTRLLHHALYPELKKDLQTLSSVYLKERNWKQWSSHKEAKRDA